MFSKNLAEAEFSRLYKAESFCSRPSVLTDTGERVTDYWFFHRQFCRN